MPVKFRCQHCKQLLGISRKKIGEVVDCPKCGRSVRVPKEDGDANPVPKPEFNLEDSALVRALDELAAIGQQQNSALESPLMPGGADDEVDALRDDDDDGDRPLDSANRSSVKGSWVPQAKYQHPEPPMVAVKVEPPPPVAPPVILPTPGAVGPGAATPAGSATNWKDVAAITPIGAAAGAPSLTPNRVRGLFSEDNLPIAVGGAGGLLGGLILGFIAGWFMHSNPKPVESAETGVEVQQPEPAHGLRGKITFKTASGEKRPDEGARILILPENRQGTLKMQVQGLRPDDNETDKKIALAAIRAAGADVAIAGADGQFTTQLSGAGNYHVIVVSAHQPSDKPQPPEILSTYLEKPADFVGQRAVHHEQVRYKGAATDPWDFSFAAP